MVLPISHLLFLECANDLPGACMPEQDITGDRHCHIWLWTFCAGDESVGLLQRLSMICILSYDVGPLNGVPFTILSQIQDNLCDLVSKSQILTYGKAKCFADNCSAVQAHVIWGVDCVGGCMVPKRTFCNWTLGCLGCSLPVAQPWPAAALLAQIGYPSQQAQLHKPGDLTLEEMSLPPSAAAASRAGTCSVERVGIHCSCTG